MHTLNAGMVDTMVTNLLDLDDHLLCEVFKSLSVHDKQQNVQRTCLRFRSVLQHPSFADTWGCITVKMLPDTEASPQSISELTNWLRDRMSGKRHTPSCCNSTSLMLLSRLQTMASQVPCSHVYMGCTCMNHSFLTPHRRYRLCEAYDKKGVPPRAI
jgi:hypothetical protein